MLSKERSGLKYSIKSAFVLSRRERDSLTLFMNRVCLPSSKLANVFSTAI